jgi:hypothetical protein
MLFGDARFEDELRSMPGMGIAIASAYGWRFVRNVRSYAARLNAAMPKSRMLAATLRVSGCMGGPIVRIRQSRQGSGLCG